MSDTNDPLGTVQRMFAAFGAGDFNVLLATIHPESRWTYIGANPQLSKAEFAGTASIRKFFEGILQRVDMTAFNTNEFIVQGETVVVFGSEAGKVKATGQPFHNEWTQKYVVHDNLITRMTEYNIQVDPKKGMT